MARQPTNKSFSFDLNIPDSMEDLLSQDIAIPSAPEVVEEEEVEHEFTTLLPNSPAPWIRVRELFLLTGGAFTMVGSKSSFSYKIDKKEGEDYFFFVSALADSAKSFEGAKYIGIINRRGFQTTKGTKLPENHPAIKMFVWAREEVGKGTALAKKIVVWESIPCTKCGRSLLKPESIAMGVGPYCAEE